MEKNVRIIQIIDSLDAGGAERMAVNLANIFSDKIAFSGLIATRKEGLLKRTIQDKVHYQFLERKRKIDVKAVKRLNRFIRENNIQIIHAHASSWFIAVLAKLLNPKCKLIWHDHYGNSEFLAKRPHKVLRFFSHQFDAIIAVNEKLKSWAVENLKTQKVVYIANFFSDEKESKLILPLFGKAGKRIICLANMRPQKGHHFLLDIAKEIIVKNPDWTFHLVGEVPQNDYTDTIKARIEKESLAQNVFVYGSRSDVGAILQVSTIGILTSSSEGLPLALLEYGFNKLPVVVTSVGEIPNVITNETEGIVVPFGQTDIFVNEIQNLIDFPKRRKNIAENWHLKCQKNYGVINFLREYSKLINESILK